MRQVGIGLFCLALTSAARADDAPETPVLSIDSGGHTATAKQVLFTPDGTQLISVSHDKSIRVWGVAGGDPLRVLRPPIGRGPEGKLFAAALAPDGRTLAVGGHGGKADDHPIFLISWPDGRIRRWLRGHRGVINALAFAPDGRRLASGSQDHTARIWDADSGRCERVLQGHGREIYGVAFSPDGRRLATASFDATGRIWSVADGNVEASLKGHAGEVFCVAWSPDGHVVATGGLDRSIRLWGPDGSALRGFDDLGGGVSSLSFAADSRSLLYTAGGRKAVRGGFLLDLDARKERVRFTRHAQSVLGGALSPDGTLAATSDGDGVIYLWKTADASIVHRLAGKGVAPRSTAWGPDGATIAWGTANVGSGLQADKPLDHAFRLPDLEFAETPGAEARRARTTLGPLALTTPGATSVAVKRGGETIATLTTTDPYDEIRCVTLLPGGRAAVGSVFGLRLFDAGSGKPIRDFLGHTGPVWAVAPSPDGRYLLSASNDQTLRVWELRREEPLLSLFFAGEDWIAWTPEGYYAASPGGETLMGWHVGHGPGRMADFHPAARFRKSLFRPDVLKLVLKSGGTAPALEAADRARGRASEPAEAARLLPPIVEIDSPRRSGKTVDVSGLEVKAIARGRGASPVTALRLLLDGRPYRGDAGLKAFDPPKPGEARASWAVELEPGRHRLAVQAETAQSRGVSGEYEITYEAREAVPLPSLYVLAVGVSDYPGDLRLNFAAKDAEAIDRVFREKSPSLYKSIEVRTLTDAKATRKEFLSGLTWLRARMTQKDVGVVFFSGHGMRDARGALYLLPVDVDLHDLLATAVGDDQFMKALGGMPGKILALLDACHSGVAGGDRRKAVVVGLTDDLVRDLVTDDYGIIVMASSMGREFSLENNAKRQSNFTLAIVEGLSGAADYNKDGAVYLNELDSYISDRVKTLTRGQQHPVTARPATIRSFPLARP